MLHVLFPRPNHFDGPIHLLGDLHGRVDHVHLESAAEAAADEVVVHGDLVERQSGDLCRDGVRPGEHLTAYPNLASGRRDMHGAVQRLHGGMGEKGQFICRFQQVTLGQALSHVSRGCGDRALRFAGGTDLFPDVIGGNGGIRPLVPRDVERAQALLGRPHVIAHDRDQILEHDNLANAREAFGLGVIDLPHRAAEHRAGGEGGELHAGRHGIDAIHHFAVDLIGGVDPFERVADQFELFDVLERRIFGRRQALGAIDQRRIGEPAAARLMDGRALLGVNTGGLDFPLLRGGLNQNNARAGRRLAQGQPERAHRI